MRYKLIDCHVHLQADVFDADRDQVIQRASHAGVEVLLCNGSDPTDWQQVRQLAIDSGQPRIVPFFGLHPWYVDQVTGDWMEELARMLESVPSGIGEIGLDRWIPNPPIDQQVGPFEAQLGLAIELRRPACIHCLRAWGPMLEQLERFGPFSAGLIIHAYGGPPDLIEPLAKLGALFSFAGNCLNPGHKRAQASLIKVPLDRLLIETDAPDLLPPADQMIYCQTDNKGRSRNEPANLPYILEGVARIRNQDPRVIEEAVWNNGQRLLEAIV